MLFARGAPLMKFFSPSTFLDGDGPLLRLESLCAGRRATADPGAAPAVFHDFSDLLPTRPSGLLHP
jgi:hypothetical protein